MSEHQWGDLDDQGRDICYRVEEAASYIGSFIARWGRISVIQTKEKFGTARVYCYLDSNSIYSIWRPRHHWLPNWWPRTLDYFLGSLLTPVFKYLVLPYRTWIYRLAYKKAIKKWPDLYEEIICMSDFGELLEGVNGYKHSDYWKEV